MPKKVGKWEEFGAYTSQGRGNSMWKSLEVKGNMVLWTKGKKFCMARV